MHYTSADMVMLPIYHLDIYWQHLIIIVATLLFCTECSETQVASSSLIGYANFDHVL